MSSALNPSTLVCPERKDIPTEDQWNLSALFPSIEAWEEAFKKISSSLQGKPLWSPLLSLKGSFAHSAENIKKFLDDYFSIDIKITEIFTYAHLLHDQDVGEDLPKTCFAKASFLSHQFKEAFSWFEPEILSLPPSLWEEYRKSPLLKDYILFLEKILRIKQHILSEKEEQLLARVADALDSSYKIFSAFDNGDLKFPSIVDQANNSFPLSQGSYGTYLKSPDRTLRKNAYEALHIQYLQHENMLAETLNGLVKKHIFLAKTRGFSSCLEASLFPHNIPTNVYHNLLQTIHDSLKSLHSYIEKRKKYLGYENLFLYDLQFPLKEAKNTNFTYAEAVDLVIQSTKVLGSTYQSILSKGLSEEGWVDKYENKRKRSGAYSSGCYTSHPYILLNYHSQFRDAMTLAHEAGHSMHSFLSRKNQPYFSSDYSIFAAEVASTFNEMLLLDHLMATNSSEEFHLFLLSQQIDDIRATFFRQALFAEFELHTYLLAEKEIPLTPQILKEEYQKIHTQYYGPGLTSTPLTAIEWARIPHFYYNFYVYQYATGIAVAYNLKELVKKEGPARYLEFLSSGSSLYPLESLKKAGVDVSKPQVIQSFIEHFSTLCSQFFTLLDKVGHL